MALDLFDSPLFAQRKYFVQEITGLDDAFDLLDEWPTEQRDLSYETAVRVCRDAAAGKRSLPAAREDSRRFLKPKGKLVDVGEVAPYLRKLRTDSFSKA